VIVSVKKGLWHLPARLVVVRNPPSSPLATTEEGRPIRTIEYCGWTLANPTFICFNSDF
jgi:hypothetical protein